MLLTSAPCYGVPVKPKRDVLLSQVLVVSEQLHYQNMGTSFMRLRFGIATYGASQKWQDEFGLLCLRL